MTDNQDINVTVESLQRLMARRDDAVAETSRLRKQLERLRLQRNDVLSIHQPDLVGDTEVCATDNQPWPCATILALNEDSR